MIQFNLLPEVKIQYLRAQTTRKVISLVAFIVTGLSIFILVLFFATHALKTQRLAKLSSDITSASKTLNSQKDINRKLTVQNQLTSLTKLHSGKPAVTQIFDYLNQVTPDKIVSITKFNVDYTLTTITITGTADSLTSVNKYIDTLKFTTFPKPTLADPKKTETTNAFSSIVLTKFTFTNAKDTGKTGAQTDQPATYIIDLKYDTDIFDNTKTIQLNVPTATTTRSTSTKPTDLFRPEPLTPKAAGAQ